eukprot:656515-Prorocentrum_minimum.AAC.2
MPGARVTNRVIRRIDLPIRCRGRLLLLPGGLSGGAAGAMRGVPRKYGGSARPPHGAVVAPVGPDPLGQG